MQIFASGAGVIVLQFTGRIIFKTAPVLLALCLGLPEAVISSTQNDDVQRAKRILREIDDLWRGESSYGRFTMHVKTRHYSRSLQMEGWSKGTEKTLMRILKPLKEKGTATLKSGKTIYSYLPRTEINS